MWLGACIHVPYSKFMYYHANEKREEKKSHGNIPHSQNDNILTTNLKLL